MTEPASPRPLPLALFWAGFHARRNLRKRAFRLWVVASVLAYLVIRVGGRLPAPAAAEMIILWAVPLLSLFFGSGVLREEIEDQTLTYAFTRPLGRGYIYAARVLAAMVPVVLLTLPFVLLETFEVDGGTGLRFLLAGAFATLAYTGIYALLGLMLKWSTWIGLAWLLIWEGFASIAPGFIGRLTLQTHLRGLGGLPAPTGVLASLWQAPGPVVSAVVLIAVTAASLALGGFVAHRREIALEK
ncbi:hypothetical protein L6V77_03090 [Myxococcota bacterium]|nr:hypothetical protein [Myxococcota bacterium]